MDEIEVELGYLMGGPRERFVYVVPARFDPFVVSSFGCYFKHKRQAEREAGVRASCLEDSCGDVGELMLESNWIDRWEGSQLVEIEVFWV